MARIVITSAGTLGDFVPFVALGKRLRGRGHEVVMAVNPAMVPLAERAGLGAVPCGRPFGESEARERAEIFREGAEPTPEEMASQLEGLGLDEVFRGLARAVEGADLLISSSLQGVAPWVHEATGVRWINATIFAMEFPHSDGPPPPQTDRERAAWRAMFDYRNRVRRGVGLPELADDRWRRYYWSERLVLIASSEHFSRPKLDDWPQARMTGFWFDDPPPGDWSPDPDLARFLEGGPPPLVLSLSSLPVEDPGRVVTLHAEAAALLGARLVVQQGWAGLTRSGLSPAAAVRDEDLHFAGHVPHSWLFPRSAAIIHHGGIGTTAQGLRCGRPMLVEPYCNDQFFNAGRVAELGVGAAVDHRRLTPENLASALEEHVLTPESFRRAEELASRIAPEDGLARSCEIIESQIEAA
jgi:UDP:flavonoid glycosyltransferase YjiC (YdhE family)